MKSKQCIFLSASVPDPSAGHFLGEGDSAAISALVSALVFVALGRRRIVWGGHPAITPMMWAFAEALGVDYGKWVKLYQSAFFEDDFPEENARFANVIITDAVRGDRDASLRVMRRRMLSENRFEAAIFAGGMAGVIDEYEMLSLFADDAKILPIISTGGAAAVLGDRIGAERDFRDDLDYVGLLFKRLSIDPNEPRG